MKKRTGGKSFGKPGRFSKDKDGGQGAGKRKSYDKPGGFSSYSDKKDGYSGKKTYGKKAYGSAAGDDARPERKFSKTGDDRKPFAKKSYGDRKPFGEKKSFGERSFGDKKPFGEKRSYGDKSYGDKKPYGEKRSYGDKPYGDKKPFGRKPYGDKKEFNAGEEGGEKRSYSKKPYGEKRAYGDKSYGEKRSYGDKSYGDKKPFGRKPYGDKKAFGSDSDGGEKRSYGTKSYGEKKSYGDKSYGGKKPYARKTFGDDKESFSAGEEGAEKRSYTKKPFGEKRSYGDKSYGEKKSFGEKKSYAKKSFGDAASGYERPKRAYGSKTADEKPYGKRSKDASGESWEVFDNAEEAGSFRKKYSPARKKAGASVSADGTIRLNKYIANAGICSRREADELIKVGAVTVNGKVVTEMGYKVSPSDVIHYGGELLRREQMVYVLLNKPKDYITTTDDPQNRKTVMELVKDACNERIVPVGRLDRNTTGLLLLTNDGELATRLTHPKYDIRKIYHVTLGKNLRPEDMKAIVEGVELEDGVIKADEVTFVGDGTDRKEVGLAIHSGRNRVVRRIFEQLGYDVIKLDRVFFAGLTKKDLPRGHWRFLSETEVGILKMTAGGFASTAKKRIRR